MKKILVLAAISSVTMLSADYYQHGRSSCPGGNCPYQSGGYSDSRQGYYPEASGQAYYRSHPDSQDRGYNYRSSQDQGYNRNNPSSQDQGYYRGQSDQQNRYDNQYRSNRDTNYSNTDASRNNRMTDEDIRNKIDNELNGGWLSSGYPNVDYNYNNGIVDLTGTVRNQDEKSKLEANVRKIDGVRQVNNQVRIDDRSTDNQNDSRMHNRDANMMQDNAASDSDRRINSRIRERLKGWFGGDYETIIISTSNGIVTITGSVDKPDDLEKINKEAKNVEGVKSVNNNASIQRN